MLGSKEKNIDFLWQSFLDGDDKSFSYIYELHINMLFAYGLKIATDREIVHDSIQEVFIDLFLKRKKIDVKIRNLKSYLFVALRHNIIKKITQAKKNTSFEKNENKEPIEFNIEYSFQEKLIEQETKKKVQEKLKAAVSNLAARQKEIIYLKFEQDLDYEDISEIMGISVESARKLLHRAMLSLRKLIKSKAFLLLMLVLLK